MTDFWLTVLVDHERTMDLRVSGESFTAAVEKHEAVDGRKVIAVRPCEKPATDCVPLDFVVSFRQFLEYLDKTGVNRPSSIQLKDKYQALRVLDQIKACAVKNDKIHEILKKIYPDIEAGVLHGFYFLNIEFCWPGEPALVNFGLGEK